MKKVAIVVGHSPSKVGAINKNLDVKEYFLNEELGKAVVEEMRDRGIDALLVYRKNAYAKLASDVNNLGVDFFISIHHNGASDASINGTETLYWWRSKTSKKMAEYINNGMLKALGYRDRGLLAVKKGHNGWPLLKKTKMPGVLIEPYFITCDKAVINRDTKSLAKGIVSAYEEFESVSR